jgi:hypothetical protein
MKIRTVIGLAVCLGIAAALLTGMPAKADHPGRNNGINERQQNQRERLKKGVQSGELTRKEVRGITTERRDIKDVEREYRADGVMTNAERADLDSRLDETSGDLLRQKHDAQDRNPAAAAGTHDPAVNARQDNQTDRIVQGVASGELTRKEATELTQERRDIKQLERDYKSDGTLTQEERTDLHQQLDQASEEIREEKHDEQQR